MTKLFFAIGLGPQSFFIASEMVGQAARSVSQGCAMASQMIARTICIAVFLGLKEAVGQSFAFLILFVAPMIFSMLYLYFRMPETKNRNHKEVIEAMEKLPSIANCFKSRKRHSKNVYSVYATPVLAYGTLTHNEKF
ncbi:unnamed protein product [Enterobius vermicularis]|uniref:MFS domain-containing protein n=1 Tax=Enterobius vermicularis TaxID=51028 RepID=A0A0N4UX69_ENTVE|nr:unnamed protein product [Enterobius vermicularis]